MTDEGNRRLMEAGPIHSRRVHRLVFEVLTPEELKALRQVTGRINARLLGEINLGTLARQTRELSTRRSR